MATLTTAIDAWIGSTTVTTTFDALIQKSTTRTTTLDAYISKLLSTTLDAYIVESRGSRRGVGSLTDRNALTALQAGDWFTVTDDDQLQHEHYWDGTTWSSQAKLQIASSGKPGISRSPTTGGLLYAAAIGDATYPLRYGAPPLRKLSTDTTGVIWAQAMGFASGVSGLNADESITLAERAGFQTPTLVQSATASSGFTTATAAWTQATTAGNWLGLLIFYQTAALTVPSGYVAGPVVNLGGGSPITAAIYYKENCAAGEANPAVSVAPNSIRVVAVEFSGIATTGSYDQSATVATASAPPYQQTPYTLSVGPTASTVQSGELAIGIIGSGDNGTTQALVSSPDWLMLKQMFQNTGSSLTLSTAYSVAHSAGPQTLSMIDASPGLPGHVDTLVGAIATFKAAPIAISTPASKTLNLRADDNAGVSALYYRDDAGVDHLIADSASAASIATTVFGTQYEGLTDVLSYLATRIRFLELASEIDYGDDDILIPDAVSLIEEQEP